MHAFILLILSFVLFAGGSFVAFGQGMADAQGDRKTIVVSMICLVIGLVGLIISVCWGLNLIWEAL